ncbi:uncharacterized protein LOC130655398 [Hydractinia symbiolongicarpus]|uniref:uncharacterized protein LOC130655398 n=1 Tax=Hydractinia symbiolongicarpus TaxID=13093 RepID=UPI00254F8AEE|nr:uncharacterized protein LOC130655398 [Hydractinia symbiolongicarpus]
MLFKMAVALLCMTLLILQASNYVCGDELDELEKNEEKHKEEYKEMIYNVASDDHKYTQDELDLLPADESIVFTKHGQDQFKKVKTDNQVYERSHNNDAAADNDDDDDDDSNYDDSDASDNNDGIRFRSEQDVEDLLDIESNEEDE